MSGRRRHHAPAGLSTRKKPGTNRTGGWVGSRAGLDNLKKIKIPSFCRNSNPGCFTFDYTDIEVISCKQFIYRPALSPTRPPVHWVSGIFPAGKGAGPDSSVGIVTGYGLDGPGIESRWRRDFPHLSKPALVSTQPPVQWVPGLFWG
jgi:hypothetical protein